MTKTYRTRHVFLTSAHKNPNKNNNFIFPLPDYSQSVVLKDCRIAVVYASLLDEFSEQSSPIVITCNMTQSVFNEPNNTLAVVSNAHKSCHNELIYEPKYLLYEDVVESTYDEISITLLDKNLNDLNMVNDHCVITLEFKEPELKFN